MKRSLHILLLTLLAAMAALLSACADDNATVPLPEDTIIEIEVSDSPAAVIAESARPIAGQSLPAQTLPPVETPTPDDGLEEKLPYYLYYEKGSFTLTIYELDENGEYTKVYKTYRTAHGGNKTPAGVFTLEGRERWHEFPDGGFVQYAVKYHNRLYMHSPLYGEEDAEVMWPKYYDGELGIGKESTGGCLRMVTEAARFIYENCPDGTTLEVVNGSPRNTVSDEVPGRNGKRFDPTDVNITG